MSITLEDLLGDNNPAPDPKKALREQAARLVAAANEPIPEKPHVPPKELPVARLARIARGDHPDVHKANAQALLAKLSSKEWRMTSGMYLILDESGITVPFKLRWEQQEFLRNRHHRNFVPKARKLGMSTFIVLDYLDDCLFTRDFRCGVIDLKQLDAEDKLSMAKFAWDKGRDHPDPAMRVLWQHLHRLNPLVDESKKKLGWKNGSIYTAGTKYTGKTPVKLHCSEFGPIAAQFPNVAQDIVRGSFNSVPMGGTIDIETTMEGGRMGECYRIFKLALKAAGMDELTELDWRLHFFSWLGHPRYQLAGIPESALQARTREYFSKLHDEHGDWLQKNYGYRTVPADRQAWWERKYESLGDYMWQQFPTTVGECDMANVVGQIYKEFTKLRADGRVTAYEPEQLPCVMAGDLGSSANTALWLIQPAGKFTNVLDCAFGEGAGAPWVAEMFRRWQAEHSRTIVQVLLPHDANITDKGSGLTYVQNLVKAGVPQRLITVVPRTPDVWTGIDAVHKVLVNSWFHSRCDKPVYTDEGAELPSGVARLEGYRVKPPGASGAVNNMPMHDICSHAADGMRTYAEAKEQHLVRVDGYPGVSPAAPEHAGAPGWWGSSSKPKFKVKMIKP